MSLQLNEYSLAADLNASMAAVRGAFAANCRVSFASVPVGLGCNASSLRGAKTAEKILCACSASLVEKSESSDCAMLMSVGQFD